MIDDTPISRRELLAGGLTALACHAGALDTVRAAGEGPTRTVRFRLLETAGLRRFGYPVHAVVPIPAGAPNLRLERDGKPVPAQFRTVTGTDGRQTVALDFNASPGPLETQAYTVSFGPDVPPGPEPKQGMSVARAGESFEVTNGSVLAYRIPHHLGHFLRSVTNSRIEFIGPDASGFTLHGRDGRGPSLGTLDAAADGSEFRGVVARQGPLAVGLRFAGSSPLGDGGRPRSSLEMTFPSSKSWVEVSWDVDDPDGAVSELALGLNLKIEGDPLLVDFGTSNTVYGQLRGEQSMALEAGDAPAVAPLATAWQVVRPGEPGASPFATAVARNAPPAEGWAHVMDRTRCTAVAVADFGRATRDRIAVRRRPARLELTRTYSGSRADPPRGPKALRFWLHFVTNPVQVGAATSPQAMLAPLVVAWEREG